MARIMRKLMNGITLAPQALSVENEVLELLR